MEPALFDPRSYDPALLVKFLEWIRQRHTDQPIVILTDVNLPPLSARTIDCRTQNFRESVAEDEVKNTVFYCIFDSDELALEVTGWIADLHGIFYPPPIYCPPASYFHVHDSVRDLMRSEFAAQRREGFEKWDCGPGDMINLIQAIDVTASLSGCFVEVGTYRGSSGRLALRYMKMRNIKRSCYFMDVFTGFDYTEARESADRIWKDTHETEGIEAIRERLMAYDNSDTGPSVRVLQHNIITDPVPEEIQAVALANIDVDLYEAVFAGLTKIGKLVVKNGIMVAEDPGHTPALIGARLALTRFLQTEVGSQFLPIYMESGQTFLIKK